MLSEMRHGLRMHPDLCVVRQHAAQRSYYIIKQMWTGKHFQVGEEEWYLMQALARHSTLTQLQRDFQRRFAPYRVSPGEVHRWLARLQSQGLLVSQQGRQGDVLYQRSLRSRWQERLSLPFRLFSFRFPPFSCERLLRGLDPLSRWLFHPLALVGMLLGLILASGLLLSASQELVQDLATRGTFLRGDNLAALGVSLVVIKVCHELSHALAARYFGAECREIGIWLMLLTPLLYCDTTDAWMISSKWRRMAVSAAGMYVELWIAIVCSCLWWASAPGPFREICLNAMVICSIGTFVFNANPLIRFDGYFILADYWGIPNLWEQAQAALWDLWRIG